MLEVPLPDCRHRGQARQVDVEWEGTVDDRDPSHLLQVNVLLNPRAGDVVIVEGISAAVVLAQLPGCQILDHHQPPVAVLRFSDRLVPLRQHGVGTLPVHHDLRVLVLLGVVEAVSELLGNVHGQERHLVLCHMLVLVVAVLDLPCGLVEFLVLAGEEVVDFFADLRPGSASAGARSPMPRQAGIRYPSVAHTAVDEFFPGCMVLHGLALFVPAVASVLFLRLLLHV